MKNVFGNLVAVMFTSLFLVVLPYQSAHAGGEMKEVCKDKVYKAGKPVMDKKTGKQAQECKKIKVHKKLEGEPVPTKK